jgi:thiol-disulfide isomerase/thioredoxin
MDIKQIWIVIAGVLILAIFVGIVTMPGYRRTHWLQRSYRPGPYIPAASSNWFGPGGTRHLLGYEGFAGSQADATFTMFGVDWCGHCQKAKPIFDSIGPTVTIDGKLVALKFVDPEKNAAQAQGYEIQGYPTYYLDCNGRRTMHKGGRDPQSIYEFLKQNLSL